MIRFLPGGAVRPRPRPGPVGPPGPPRRPPGSALRRPPPLLWAARRASARPPSGRSASPGESAGDPLAPRGAARRPGDEPGWPRRAAARPPPCGCGGLRRCSLIERLFLGQAHPCAPGTAAGFRSPRRTDAVGRAFTRTAPGTTTLPRRRMVPGGLHAAQNTHRQNPPSPEVHRKPGKLPPTNRLCDPVHHRPSCPVRYAVLSSGCIESIHQREIKTR